MVLIPHKGEVSPKSHDKVLHVLDDRLFYLTLVHIGLIPRPDLLYIDEVQHVLILKHFDGADSTCGCGNGLRKVIGQAPLMMIEILLQQFTEFVFVPFVDVGLMDIEKAFTQVFGLSQYLTMVSKTDADKCLALNSAANGCRIRDGRATALIASSLSMLFNSVARAAELK